RHPVVDCVYVFTHTMQAGEGAYCPGDPNGLAQGLPATQGTGRPLLTTQGGMTMLVLTRNVGEKIVIDGNIQGTVVAVKGNKVRIGIEAPDYVRVERQEGHQPRAPLGETP